MRSLPAATLLTFAGAAHAAGGHFDVDDATVLDSGHCQVEAWAVRAAALGATAAHLGPGCRVGPVEIGVNLDRLSLADADRTLLGPQLKWVVDPVIDTLSIGIAWAASFDLTNRGRPSQTAYVPLTWRVARHVAVHANGGVDRDFSGTGWRRQGLSGEWAASGRWTVIAERVRIVGDWTSRVGGRFNVSDTLSIDLSAARVGPRAERVVVIGLNRDFTR